MQTHDDSEGAFEPILAFDSDSAEFSRGFEAGRIWALLSVVPTTKLVEVVHCRNAEMMLRMAEAMRYRVSSEEGDDVWMRVEFSPDTTSGAGHA